MPALIALALALQGASWSDPRISLPKPWKEPGHLHVVWIQSPNYNARAGGIADVDGIIVHSTVIPTLETTTVAFSRGEPANKNPVSATFTIGKDGSIVQNVSTFGRAWHAGTSVGPDGRKNLNGNTIGIELVNLNDGKDPYPEAQLQALRGIIATMIRRFPIKYLASHEYIAQPPGRKNDPKAFPWERLRDFGLPIYIGEHPLPK